MLWLPVSWLAICHTKMCLFWQTNMVSHMTYSTVADMSARLLFLIYVYESLCGFLTIHLDLVLMILLFCGIVTLSPGVFIVYFLLSSLTTSLLCWSCTSSHPWWMHLVCWQYCVLLMLLLLVCTLPYATGLLLIDFSMSSNRSACVYKWFFGTGVSAVTDVGLMCHLSCVILLPFVVNYFVYAWSWWLWSPVLTIIPWVHGPLFSHQTATADPMGRDANTGEASLLFLYCLSTSLLWCSSSESVPIGFWSKTGMILQTSSVKH